MRISDWSSDVCSSDLHALIGFVEICVETESEIVRTEAARSGEIAGIPAGRPLIGALARAARNARPPAVRGSAGLRSEEHTSELQSLMRISYAVFCLKKKKNKHRRQTIHTNEQKRQRIQYNTNTLDTYT